MQSLSLLVKILLVMRLSTCIFHALNDFCFSFQVETVAQFGVIFLLFALGLEFSTAKVFIFEVFFKHLLGICTRGNMELT